MFCVETIDFGCTTFIFHTRYIYRILVASLTKLGSRWLFNVEIDRRLHLVDVYVLSLQCIINLMSNGQRK